MSSHTPTKAATARTAVASLVAETMMPMPMSKLRPTSRPWCSERSSEPKKSSARLRRVSMRPKVPEQLGDHGAAQQELDEARVADDPEHEADRRGHRQREERVEPRRLGGQQPGVHADHQELAVGEVDDVHHPEDDGEAQGDEGEDQAQEQTGHERAEQDVHCGGCLRRSDTFTHSARNRGGMGEQGSVSRWR